MKPRLVEIALFLGLMWTVFLIDPAGSMHVYGIRPQDRDHFLLGIVMLPLLHGSLGHIMSNTIFLAASMPIMAMLDRDFWVRIALMIVGSGALLWYLGTPGELHIGASCLVFAVIGYLAVIMIDRIAVIGLLAVIVIAWWKADFLASNILPGAEGISTIGHLAGLIVGVTLGLVWKPRG